MRESKRNILGALIAGPLAVLLTPVSAQVSTTANGPYYATPSWDQQLTTNRFVILANWNSEAVLDRETGLVWQRSPAFPSGGISWFAAVNSCAGARTGGRFGWRLPTLTELSSLLDPSASSGPPLPTGHPFTGLSATNFFPSSTDYPNDGDLFTFVAWHNITGSFVIHASTQVGSGKSVNFLQGVWCVRGGQGLGPF